MSCSENGYKVHQRLGGGGNLSSLMFAEKMSVENYMDLLTIPRTCLFFIGVTTSTILGKCKLRQTLCPTET